MMMTTDQRAPYPVPCRPSRTTGTAPVPPRKPRDDNARALLFGKNLARLRHENGWSQTEFAKHSGVPKRSLAGYELGRIPPADVALDMARTLGVSVEDLFAEEEVE